eukprot:scaffold1166_cov261-Pinguiococcus_pyrenoidosus.AAC.28
MRPCHANLLEKHLSGYDVRRNAGAASTSSRWPEHSRSNARLARRERTAEAIRVVESCEADEDSCILREQAPLRVRGPKSSSGASLRLKAPRNHVMDRLKVASPGNETQSCRAPDQATDETGMELATAAQGMA